MERTTVNCPVEDGTKRMFPDVSRLPQAPKRSLVLGLLDPTRAIYQPAFIVIWLSTTEMLMSVTMDPRPTE